MLGRKASGPDISRIAGLLDEMFRVFLPTDGLATFREPVKTIREANHA